MKRVLQLLLPCLLCLAGSASAADKPNILFILSDDYGLDGVGCYGSDRFKGKTPNLDALAKAGIRFTQCYSTPLCGPSRCTIMTGRYGFRTGGSTNQSAGQPSFKRRAVARQDAQAGRLRHGHGRQVAADGRHAGRLGLRRMAHRPDGGRLVLEEELHEERRARRDDRGRLLPRRLHGLHPGLLPAASRAAVLLLLPDASHPRPDPAHAGQQERGPGRLLRRQRRLSRQAGRPARRRDSTSSACARRRSSSSPATTAPHASAPTGRSSTAARSTARKARCSKAAAACR